VQHVYLMDYSKKRVLVVAASEALKYPDFKAAMDKEIAALRENDCIEEIHLADNVNAVSTRWVFTIKKGMTETLFQVRLVARRYEDAEKGNIPSDSTVASAAAQRLVLAACAERQWIPHSWDFSPAFLQGKYIDRKATLSLLLRMVTQPQVLVGGSKSLLTAYVLLPSPGTIASGKLALLLDLTVTSLTRQYSSFLQHWKHY
jgi:Reverse transcriptase (RNA-dependent DNA polymerase)